LAAIVGNLLAAGLVGSNTLSLVLAVSFAFPHSGCRGRFALGFDTGADYPAGQDPARTQVLMNSILEPYSKFLNLLAF
jgi:hypothetical protein